MTDRARPGQVLPVSREPEPTARPSLHDIYQAEFAYVWRTLRRLGVATRDLEDLAHDVFVVVHRKRDDYDPTRPIRPWLFGIAYRIASDDRRRSRPALGGDVELDVADDAPSATDAIESRQARELVLRALAAIDLDQRAVLVMHDIDGHSAPEIAAAIGVPLNTVYSRLRLAREKFAAAVHRLRLRTGETP